MILASMALGAICLFFALFVFEKLASFKKAPPREEPTAEVLRIESFVVENAALRRYVSGFGTTRVDREVVVSAEVAGRVMEVNRLEVGNPVVGPNIAIDPAGVSQRNGGDVIVQIDPQTYQQRLNQVLSLIEQAEIGLQTLEKDHATNQVLVKQQQRRLETAQREYDRQLALVKQQAGRESDLSRVSLELEQYKETETRLEKEITLYPVRVKEQQALIATRRNDLRLAELELEKATVISPFSGVLSEVYVETGQYVRPGEALVKVTAVDKVEVALGVPLSEASRLELLLAENKEPVVELARTQDDFTREGAKFWKGFVRRINPVADEQTRTVEVFVEVDNAEQATPLRPGTFTYARIDTGTVPINAGFLIPRDAIVNGHVFVARSEAEPSSNQVSAASSTYQTAKRTPVKVAEMFQTFALVSEGLNAGDQIVVTNLDIVKDDSSLDVRKVRTLGGEFTRLRVPYLGIVNDPPAPERVPKEPSE